ncbi:MAG TPA: YeeE/YedE thiosulfate transporter family protein [Verrucomicrobiae bacterium]|nr:YeeE/YedE thiosulfate transporter family protein [Verrucomicrobiae bacterium]
MKEPKNTFDERPVKGRWNPYAVGVGLGILSWLAFAIVNNPLGISTPISSAASLCATPIMGVDAVAKNAYWTKFPFKMDYHMLFLIGTFLGSLLSVLVSRSFRLEALPSIWSEHFGNSRNKRMASAFVGGAVIMYGARMAGGCTSGHGISGCLQLALSSWVFFLILFGFGLITAFLLFRAQKDGR